MATVRRKKDESFESMFHRFKRRVNDDLILSDLKKHEYYVSPSEKRRIKSKEARAKARKAERMNNRYRNMYDGD